MNRPNPRKTKVASRSVQEWLRRRIITGALAPGSRIPTLDELEQRFGASRHTLQSALRRLRQDGFLQPRGKRGTFVVDHPPHLCRYGLILPFRPGGAFPKWSHYHDCLRRETERIVADGKRRFQIYYGVEGPSDIEDYRRLVYDVEQERLAGLIFIIAPEAYRNTPVLSHPGLPRIAFASVPVPQEVLRLDFGNDRFFDIALRHFHRRRRRRIAFLFSGGTRDSWTSKLTSLQPLFDQYGLETRDEWIQMAPYTHAGWAGSLTRLLVSRPDGPDGLFIFDDNLVEDATHGLLAANVKIPDDLDVVAHANFPYPTPSAVPTLRLGFNVREIMDTCIDLIDRRRAGRSVPQVTRVRIIKE